MDLIELGTVLGDFFEDPQRAPSHDQLDQAFARAGLSAGDPAPSGKTPQGAVRGKTKRIREVLVFATDNDGAAGVGAAREVVSVLRGDGAFSPTHDRYVGTAKIGRLREAFAPLGYTLEESGALRPTVIDNLVGIEMTDALRVYVNRINLNPDDAPLQIGAGKYLDEADARHVLQELTGTYPVGGHAGSFPVTLAQAFTLLGFAVPTKVDLNSDPHRAVQECLFLLGTAVNRLRNDAGDGHGRPGPPRKTQLLTPAEGRLVARATALLAGALLDTL